MESQKKLNLLNIKRKYESKIYEAKEYKRTKVRESQEGA